jgi:hypothetical protein
VAKRHYFHIREDLIHRHQELFKAAKARGETTCPQTGKPLIDLSDQNCKVLVALSKKTLLVRDNADRNNEVFILIVDPDTDSIPRRSAATQMF